MKFSKEILKGAAEMIILRTLDNLGKAYGYELIKDISRSSDNIFEFQEGTIYPLLYRLEDKGYVVSNKQKIGEKTRRYYRLTDSGRKKLKEEQGEWLYLVKGLKHILHCEYGQA